MTTAATKPKETVMTPTTGMRVRRQLMVALMLLALAVPAAAGTASAAAKHRPTHGHLLVSGLQGEIGGTIGPDGAIYVPENVPVGGGVYEGVITRIDARNGKTSTYADGLPGAPFAGVIDVAFVGTHAYALVTLVDPAVYGIYDVATGQPIADIGAWSILNPPPPDINFFVPGGVQFALQALGPGEFLVTDGHHNRVLHVTSSGDPSTAVITPVIQLGNVVPTGLEVAGSTVYVSEVGPVPYNPSTGRVVSFDLSASPPRTATVLATGASAVIDVELGPDGVLYALSQGDRNCTAPEGFPASPATGKLLRVNADGTFSVVVDGINLASDLEIVGDDAYVVTLGVGGAFDEFGALGEVWRINNIDNLAKHADPVTSPSGCP